MSKLKVVIVGGGFGGIKTALELVDHKKFDVYLISEIDSFRYYPSLYRTATGGRKNISQIKLDNIFSTKKIQLICESAVKIDRDKKEIVTKGGDKFPYDTLVLALGVKTNYFGIKGLKDYSYGLKSIQEAEELKDHLHKLLIEENRQDANYVVIGGGPTGVELAGALPSYIEEISQKHGLRTKNIHVDLIEAAPRILPRMPKDISRNVSKRLRKLGIKLFLGTAVKAQSSDTLMLNNKEIRSHTVIWTAGVTNNPFFSENEFQLAKNNKVRVDQFLQAEPGIYVIGDNADTPYSGMAQTALYDGEYIAKNLKLLANNEEPESYRAKKPVYVIPAGPKFAAVLWGKFRIYGRLGNYLRRAADFLAYNDYIPWQVAAQLWVEEDDEETKCPRCA